MDIIICSYETLRKGQVNLGAVDFEIVVLDEAQRIKSPSTQIASAAKALNAKFKIAATGTPIENSRMDLWSIMDFCAPGILGSAEDFIRMQNVCDIQKRMGKHFLRRVKQDVIEDLPEIMTVKNKNLMEETQADMYLDVVREYKPGVNDLQTIHDLKTISEHPLLYCGILDEANVNDIISCSARMENTMDILSNIRRVNEKVIIFVERKDMQKAMAKVFWQKFKLDVGIVNGDIPTFDKHGHNVRQQLIDDFSAVRGFNIIIMPPLSSGVGLNVVAANHVIHYSRHWNPAKEQQATDRVYRIGQTKDVHVYYPMAVHPVLDYSFDETLDELLQQKKHLADSTIYPIDKLEITAEDFAKQMFT